MKTVTVTLREDDAAVLQSMILPFRNAGKINVSEGREREVWRIFNAVERAKK